MLIKQDGWHDIEKEEERKKRLNNIIREKYNTRGMLKLLYRYKYKYSGQDVSIGLIRK